MPTHAINGTLTDACAQKSLHPILSITALYKHIFNTVILHAHAYAYTYTHANVMYCNKNIIIMLFLLSSFHI